MLIFPKQCFFGAICASNGNGKYGPAVDPAGL
jgi:hypothetical protein